MDLKMKTLSLLIALLLMSFASQAQAQDINLPCLFDAVAAASSHQCSNPERRFGCFLEKAAVGGAAYARCNGGFSLRGRIYARRAIRQQVQPLRR